MRIDGYTSSICFHSPAQICSIEKSKILFDRGNPFKTLITFTTYYISLQFFFFLFITLRLIAILLYFAFNRATIPSTRSALRNQSRYESFIYLFFFSFFLFLHECSARSKVLLVTVSIKLPADKSLVEIIL